MMQAKDLELRANHAGAVVIFTTPSGMERFETVAEECPTLVHRLGDTISGSPASGALVALHGPDPCTSRQMVSVNTAAESPAMIYYTSGTSGYRKESSTVIGPSALLRSNQIVSARRAHDEDDVRASRPLPGSDGGARWIPTSD
jgi:hypothetical protein